MPASCGTRYQFESHVLLYARAFQIHKKNINLTRISCPESLNKFGEYKQREYK